MTLCTATLPPFCWCFARPEWLQAAAALGECGAAGVKLHNIQLLRAYYIGGPWND
eukprot:CAMPEP_0181402578 /NCGR_PEP_ID=MMETSP1110-20121109/3247_1 /TAXON_ID=174948 /ORGANISM="Symbiodinium sp., Strain CCMP421" /LENGTH=54 /DNA_ID=CAMNT_0023524801 /DNA_START=245 /DNA_END=409 /DNA_ORIENTATION=-